MQTIHYSISDKKALSTPDKPVLVAGESGTSEIVLSTVPTAWDGFEVRALLTTPTRKSVDAFAVGSGFLLTNTMLDAQGYLYIEFVAYRGGTEIDRSLPDKLYVNAGRKAEGDIDPAPLPDLVAEMVAAKDGCDGAAAAAVLATERIETTDADIKAAEAVREEAEEAREDAENIRIEKADVFVAKHPKTRKAYVTIIDDDGKSEFMANLKPVFDAHGIKPSVAINPDKIGTTAYMSWPEIEGMNAAGYEILNHGYSHIEPLILTLEQIQANYAQEKAIFEAHGLTDYDYYVYPGYTAPPAVPNQVSNFDLKNRLRKVYKCCLNNATSPENYMPFEAMEVKRIGAYSGEATKAYIDFCITNGCWCVLFGHAWMAGCTAVALDDILTYIDAKIATGSAEYATVKDMVDNYSAVIDLGNGATGADYFRLDKNGMVDFSVGGRDINTLKSGLEILEKGERSLKVRTTDFVDADITTYPSKSVTAEFVTYAVASAMGLPDLGTIITVRDDTASYGDLTSYQEYHRATSLDVWERRYRSAKSRWDLWFPRGMVARTTATRPRYAPQGLCVYDTTIAKPIYSSSTSGYTPNAILARSTAYKKWDVVNSGGYLLLCIVAGTTATVAPTYDVSAPYNNTVDGTVTWQYLGAPLTAWKDASGTTV